MSRILILVVVAAVAIETRPAQACSCSPGVLTSPAADATDVPLDAGIFIRADSLTVASTTLTDSENHSIELQGEDHHQWVLFRHADLLVANQRYTFTSGTAIQFSFTTGSTTTTAPVAYAGATAIAFDAFRYPVPDSAGNVCINSCVQLDSHRFASRITATGPPAPVGTAWLSLELTDATSRDPLGDIALSTFQAEGFTLGLDYCDHVAFSFQNYTSLCGELIAYASDGSVIGTPTSICSDVNTCERAVDETCYPTDECAADTSSSSGCAATDRSGAWLGAGALLALVLLRRKKR